MKSALKDSLAKRLFAHIDDKSTDRSADTLTLGATEYVDPRRADRERAWLRTTPVIVAVSEELVEPGEFLTREVLGVNVLLTRQDDGTVKAFRNVCRHRCSTVVSAEGGRSKSFSCPYHGWTYGLDGALIALPDQQGSFPSVQAALRGLIELPAAEKHGLVWVVVTAGGSLDLGARLGPEIDDELADMNLASYKLLRAETFEQPANWKLIVDGFLEVYHVRYLHPATVGKITISNVMLVDYFGDHLRVASARKDIEKLRPVDGEQPDILPGILLTYALMPNVVVVYVRDHVEVWSVVPHDTDPGRCRITLRFLVPELPSTEKSAKYWQRNWDMVVTAVQDEDWAAAREIQRNLGDGIVTDMVFGRNEMALHHFHEYLDKEIDHR